MRALWNHICIQKFYYIIIGIILVFFVGGSFFSYYSKKESEEVVKDDVVMAMEKQEEKKEMVSFDIKGQVKSPGVYQLEQDATVMDAIKKSGGLTENADTTYLNLSRKIKDEMVIIVYSKEEIHAMKEGKENVVVVEGKCVCPKITNDACLKEEETVTNKPKKETPGSPTITGPINLNTATQEELDSLPGIGPSKALDIIAYREEHHGFKTIDELKNVKGIGDATFDKLKDKITVS